MHALVLRTGTCPPRWRTALQPHDHAGLIVLSTEETTHACSTRDAPYVQTNRLFARLSHDVQREDVLTWDVLTSQFCLAHLPNFTVHWAAAEV